MSRHRNMRKVSLGDDDYDEDIAQSFDDKYSYAVSPGTSELYMYNRNSQGQNISQFIKGHIVEEDHEELEVDEEDEDKMNHSDNFKLPESNPQQQQQSKIKNDDDFMFLMDKEPSMRASLKFDEATKPKDDLDSLLNAASRLFDTNVSTDSFLANDSLANTKSLIDQFSCNNLNVEENSASFFNTRLSSLAAQYQPISNQNADSLTLSSSVDNLIDSFFAKNFTENLKLDSIVTNENDATLINEDENLNNSATLNITRSQSININNVKKVKESSMGATFSLSDIANEYLASMTPSSVTNLTATPLATSLVDLIDHEFNHDTSNFTVNLNKDEIFLKKDRLLLHHHRLKEETARLSSSLNLQSRLSLDSISSSLPNDNNNAKLFTASPTSHNNHNRVEFLQPSVSSHFSEIQRFIENIYAIKNESLLAGFLSHEKNADLFENETNELFAESFAYKKQMADLNARKTLFRLCRRKIVYEGRMSKKKKIASETRSDENRLVSNSEQSPKQRQTKSFVQQAKFAKKSKISAENSSSKSRKSGAHKSIQMFDFSIPSPDDIVAAKQKFAFKNSRLKQ